MKSYKWIPGYEGKYKINKRGSVRQIGRKQDSPFHTDRDGYSRISLYSAGKLKKYAVHRLVMITFCPHIDAAKMHVEHLDGNPANNRLENLKWSTCQENHHRKKEHGRWVSGERHGRAKLTHKTVKTIRSIYANQTHTQKDLAKMFDVDQTQISRVILHQTWRSQ